MAKSFSLAGWAGMIAVFSILLLSAWDYSQGDNYGDLVLLAPGEKSASFLSSFFSLTIGDFVFLLVFMAIVAFVILYPGKSKS